MNKFNKIIGLLGAVLLSASALAQNMGNADQTVAPKREMSDSTQPSKMHGQGWSANVQRIQGPTKYGY